MPCSIHNSLHAHPRQSIPPPRRLRSPRQPYNRTEAIVRLVHHLQSTPVVRASFTGRSTSLAASASGGANRKSGNPPSVAYSVAYSRWFFPQILSLILILRLIRLFAYCLTPICAASPHGTAPCNPYSPHGERDRMFEPHLQLKPAAVQASFTGRSFSLGRSGWLHVQSACAANRL